VAMVAYLLMLGRWWGVSGCGAGRVGGRWVLRGVCGVSDMWVLDRSVMLWVCGVSAM
jgi:hypothetical protein